MIDEMTGLYGVDIDKMINMLSKAYISLIETRTPFNNFPSVMLWGAPGVGKSQGVREIAEKIEEATYKRVVVTDVRLLLFNPVDLRGIPTSNADKTLAVWLKPKIFQMDEGEDVVNILFLDEISVAPPSVQAAAYQITLDRTIGEHKLPNNCIVIAAGNRTTDKSVAYNMPKALANRMCHIEVKGNSSSWHDWAVKNAIHPYIVAYLEYNTTALMRFESAGMDVAFPTPRSWEMASNVLKLMSEDIDEVYPLLVGCIGHNAASKIKTWSNLYKSMPSIKDIFSGKEIEPPKASELQIVLRSAMVAYARENLDKKLIDNSIQFACRMSMSFRKKYMHDLYYIPSVRPILKDNEVFKDALKDGLK